MPTGLELFDRARNRDRFRYNWRRAQMLTNPSYITTRRKKVAEVEEEKVAKEKKKADKVLREKEKLAEKEARKAKKTKAREDKENQQALNKESRGKKRKESNEVEVSKKKSKSKKTFCYCKKYKEEEMLGCDGGDDEDCPGNGWYHPSCVGLTAEDVRALKTWVCSACK